MQAQVSRLIGSLLRLPFFCLRPRSEDRISVNILILNYEYPPVGGGAGVTTAALARGLADHGFDVEVVTAGIDSSPKIEIEAHETDVHGPERSTGLTKRGRVRIHRLSTGRSRLHEGSMLDAARYLLAALPTIRKLAASRDYDAAQLFFSLPTGLILPFAGLGKVPVVVSLRGSDVPGYDPSDRMLQRVHRLLRPFTRWIWRRADRVVTVSEGLGRLARRTDPTLEYTVIRNGVDTDIFHPPARKAPGAMIRCIAVARLIERKGFDNLLQALHLLPRGSYHLEIVGTGKAEESIRQLAKSLGLESEVEFAGALDHAAVAERYRHADIFTLTPENEAFGNVFAEALASGLPIIASEVGGIPEFVEHGVNGHLVPPAEPAILASAIRQLGEDPELREEMSARNRVRAEESLSWGEMTANYVRVYRELSSVGGTSSRPAVSSALPS